MQSLVLQQQKNCLWYRGDFGLFLAKEFLPRFLVVSPLENFIRYAIFRVCYIPALDWDPEAKGNHQDTAAQGSAYKLFFQNSIPLEQVVWWSLLTLLLLAGTSLHCLVELHFFPVFQLDTANTSSSLWYLSALTDLLCSMAVSQKIWSLLVLQWLKCDSHFYRCMATLGLKSRALPNL